jgi:leader peptidase (prepilin peptidase)/N-methyltransferase
VLGLCFAPFVPVRDFTAQMFLSLAGVQLPAWASSLAESAVGAALPAFLLWFGGWLYLRIRHREGLGFGDVKLIAMVGAFLGLRGALVTLILGSFTGSVIGFGYIKLAGKDPATFELPFGSFLGAAALVAAVFRWM